MFKLINLRFPQLNTKLERLQAKYYAPLYVLIFGLLTSSVILGVTAWWYNAHPPVAYTADNLVGESELPAEVVYFTPTGSTEETAAAPPSNSDSLEKAEAGEEQKAAAKQPAVEAAKAVEKEPDLSEMKHPLQGKMDPGYEFIYSEIYEDYRLHPGFDYAAQEGSKVMAALDGVVKSITETGTGGFVVTLKHGGGWETSYTAVETGLKVNQYLGKGAELGRLVGPVPGETGNGSHLHFELRKDGQAINPGDYLQ